MATKNGVEYDLTRTPYYTQWDDYTFFFSSLNHLEKFEKKLYVRTEWLRDSLSKRFHFDIECEVIAALQLYMQIETRGFRIWFVDGIERFELTCPETITLSGLKISARHSTQPLESTIML